ncbi:monovalent cation:proton antiporter-2 (CPA2) family protein [Dongshaea marina]|uniref:monovalent cation:proton antiporter-2 (CPA2) family protein n=1 Tax=Dongshaea marina TaxID=2047966 RepID=UPI000D3E596B|nr:monovalent cation:proton antiporter-2 (CPA2) family protein [Dongshaea marina]
MDGFLYQAFIYLTAAVIAVPLAKKLGLGSVLGYLIAGIFIGPIIGLVGAETQNLKHFAEFGVVMMLFLVGLELEPQKLWAMRGKLLGLGGLQVGLTTGAITLIGILLGLYWSIALTLGLIFCLSSTAIVLQTLNEKGLMKTQGGESTFSVLLFQDIAVIPMLALLPLLAMPALTHSKAPELLHQVQSGATHFSLTQGLPGWAVALVIIASVSLILFASQFLMRPLLRYTALAKSREIFTATALLLVIGIALLMTLIGLSPALGTFLAGVALAGSEFKHELESDIEPFKGLLLGLFFITVGAGINFQLLFNDFTNIILITLGIMLLKGVVLYCLTLFFKIRYGDRWLFSLGLAQAGEFGFVLLSFSLQNSIIPEKIYSTMSLVVALSMMLTPGLFIFYEKVIATRIIQDETKEADAIDEQGSVIIAGHGRFGQIINRMLVANGIKTVVLDHKPSLVENMRRFGIRSFFGDVSRPDLLHAAGLHSAKILIIAIDNKDKITEIVRYARKEAPHLHIIARAVDRHHVYSNYYAGANDIVRETFDSSVRAGRYALEALGFDQCQAQKMADTYVQYDRETLVKLAKVYDPEIHIADNPDYVSIAQESLRLLAEAMTDLRSKLESNPHECQGTKPNEE